MAYWTVFPLVVHVITCHLGTINMLRPRSWQKHYSTWSRADIARINQQGLPKHFLRNNEEK